MFRRTQRPYSKRPRATTRACCARGSCSTSAASWSGLARAPPWALRSLGVLKICSHPPPLLLCYRAACSRTFPLGRAACPAWPPCSSKQHFGQVSMQRFASQPPPSLHTLSLSAPEVVGEPGVACRYVLVTPLVDSEWGGSVLINRGWVPAAWRTDAALRARCQPRGQVHNLSAACSTHPVHSRWSGTVLWARHAFK